MRERLLRDDEAQALIMAAVHGAARVGADGVTKDDLWRLIQWAESVLVDAALVRALIAGQLAIHVTGENPDDWSLDAIDNDDATAAEIRRRLEARLP